jgi:hypothetical protein
MGGSYRINVVGVLGAFPSCVLIIQIVTIIQWSVRFTSMQGRAAVKEVQRTVVNESLQ